ncbi:MAG: nucleoside kinase [Agathobacter sp.]|nr:nucleoside kinase [Agathobacter sp.]
MQEFEITILLPKSQGETEKSITRSVKEGTTFHALAEEVAQAYPERFDGPIMLASFENKIRELSKSIGKSGTLSFETATGKDGKRVYRRSVTFLMEKAVANLWGAQKAQVRVYYSLGQGYYCELEQVDNTKENFALLKTEMKRLVEENLAIRKESMKTDYAEAHFTEQGMEQKARLLHYRRSSRTNIYNLDGLLDYFYGYMAYSTGELKTFDVLPYGQGFVLLFPNKNMSQVEPLETSEKLHETLQSSKKWSQMLSVGTIGALNDLIAKGRAEELILTQEALMEDEIGDLAGEIVRSGNKKFIMIAGPSSSGKTTFSNRLSMQLSAKGVRPHPIALDDYYVDRDRCPKDENGEYDFECLEAIDVAKFNEDMCALMRGEEVAMPSFNFKTGKREYRGNTLKLSDRDVLVIEGIHGLNHKLSASLPDESKFRIYISALTQLNIDEHNPLPTTDGRLLRRIVRDARTRNTTARETIAMWDSVRRGEEKYIFPYQDGADVMFNSALVYELAVLKIYAEPLLFQIPKDCKEYTEAKRLLKFLDYFLPMPTEAIGKNSLMREFIGGSCFNV